MKKKLKITTYLIALILAVMPILGCGLLSPHKKNAEGFYERHYWTCGPVALEKAINEFYRKQGIVFAKNPAPRKEISQLIQKRSYCVKEALSFFHRDAVNITWPSDIKYIANLYNFDLITIDNLSDLDPQKDIAIVLIHGKFFSKEYHWVVFPLEDVENFYEKKTVIDAIFLLKWKGE
jgi:hypothetical protein